MGGQGGGGGAWQEDGNTQWEQEGHGRLWRRAAAHVDSLGPLFCSNGSAQFGSLLFPPSDNCSHFEALPENQDKLGLSFLDQTLVNEMSATPATLRRC